MIRIFNHYVSKMAFFLLLLELGILLSATILAGELLPPRHHHPGHVGGRYLTSIAFTVVILFSMSALGMYQHTLRAGVRSTLVRLIPSFALGFLLMHALIMLRPDMYMGRASIGLVFAIGATGVTLTRIILVRSAASSFIGPRLLFVGGGPLARDCIAQVVARTGAHSSRVVGCVQVEGEEICVPEEMMLAQGEPLLDMARRHGVTEIVVALANRRGAQFPVHQLLECALRGMRVIDAATFFEREASQIRIDSLQPS